MRIEERLQIKLKKLQKKSSEKKEKGREELYVAPYHHANWICFDSCAQTNATPNTENTMNTVDTITASRKYLLEDIWVSRSDHHRAIDKACHINPVRPESIAQFIDWMENKKYKIDKDVDINEPVEYGMSEIMDAIDFRPSEPDHIKRKAAYKQLEDEYVALKLRINVLEPSEKMIEETRKFKTKTYH